MRSIISLLSGALFLLSCASCSRFQSLDKAEQRLLGELDGYVNAADVYFARKCSQLEMMDKLANEQSGQQRLYDIEMDRAGEYFSFRFDSTQACLKHCQALAGNDRERFDKASIKLGLLYAKSGYYMEAYNVLYQQIDAKTLSPDLKKDYLLALYEFSRNIAGGSGLVETLSVPEAAQYRNDLLQMLPENSVTWRELLRDRYFEDGQLARADSVGRLLLSGTMPDSREYAVYAFWLSEIANARGRANERMEYLVRSAECDIINSVKDYASLTMVAQIIIDSDLDHSFRYLRVALSDAVFYGAKLRPWQIAASFNDVHKSYEDNRARLLNHEKLITVIASILAIILAIAVWIVSVRSKKLSAARKDLEQTNKRLENANNELNELNDKISKADKVKQRYILSFLEDLSGKIGVMRAEDSRYRNLLKQGKADQLLRELSLSSRSEKARKDFYSAFDQTFLAMYPGFVESFNNLLREEERITPAENRLTTELRIFALMRLGIEDSKQIASLLDCSQSTVYNYKVAIRNAAICDRATFDEQVKMIGM